MEFNDKVYLTSKEKKVFLVDIGVWILILIKIYQIIHGVKMKIKSIQLSQLLIKFCLFVVIFWQAYGIINIAEYSRFAIINDALCTLIIGISSLILLYMAKKCTNKEYNFLAIQLYSKLLIIYGFTQSIYASLSYEQFGSIVTLGVTLSIITLIIGLIFSDAKYSNEDFS